MIMARKDFLFIPGLGWKKNMNKREKIFIIITGVVLIYGILDYFVFSSFEKNSAGSLSPQVAAADAAVSEQINTHLNGIGLWMKDDKKYNQLIQLIESQWTSDPFAKIDTPIEQKQRLTQSIESSDFIYSGFIQIGKKILAVINGMEYEPGECLQDSNYKIITITPDKIVLRRDKNKALTLYLKED